MQIKLRKYQEDAVRRILKHLQQGVSPLLFQLMVGGGKTVIFTEICKKYYDDKKKVLIVAHRIELLEQIISQLEKYDIQPGIIKSGRDSEPAKRIQVASIQTLDRRSVKNKFDLVIIDEAHHSTAKSYNKLFDGSFGSPSILGVTATPTRTDGQPLGERYVKLLTGPFTSQLINDGYLVKPKIHSTPLEVDLSSIPIVRGDYEENMLFKTMDKRAIYGDLVKTYERFVQGGQGIVFAVNVGHSKKIASEYQANGIMAVHLDAETKPDDRKQIIDNFRKGKIQVLCNYMLFTEGFDVPNISFVQLARPTKSRSLYTQMVGRAMRSNPSKGKEFCYVLDHAKCIEEHGYPDQDFIWVMKNRFYDIDENEDETEEDIQVQQTTNESDNFQNEPDQIASQELVEISSITKLIKPHSDNYEIFNIIANRAFDCFMHFSRFGIDVLTEHTKKLIVNSIINTDYLCRVHESQFCILLQIICRFLKLELNFFLTLYEDEHEFIQKYNKCNFDLFEIYAQMILDNSVGISRKSIFLIKSLTEVSESTLKLQNLVYTKNRKRIIRSNEKINLLNKIIVKNSILFNFSADNIDHALDYLNINHSATIPLEYKIGLFPVGTIISEFGRRSDRIIVDRKQIIATISHIKKP